MSGKITSADGFVIGEVVYLRHIQHSAWDPFRNSWWFKQGIKRQDFEYKIEGLYQDITGVWVADFGPGSMPIPTSCLYVKKENCKCNIGDDGCFNLCRACELKIEDERQEAEEKWIPEVGDIVKPKPSSDPCWNEWKANVHYGSDKKFEVTDVGSCYKSSERWISTHGIGAPYSCLELVSKAIDRRKCRVCDARVDLSDNERGYVCSDSECKTNKPKKEEKNQELILGDYVEILDRGDHTYLSGERGYVRNIHNDWVWVVVWDGKYHSQDFACDKKYFKFIERRGIIPNWLPSNIKTHHWQQPPPLLWPNTKPLPLKRIECACCHGQATIISGDWSRSNPCKPIPCPECSPGSGVGIVRVSKHAV